jgi:hypothetical protein
MQAVLTNGAFTLFRDAIPQIEFSDQITTDLCSSVSQAATPDMLLSKRECNRLQLTARWPIFPANYGIFKIQNSLLVGVKANIPSTRLSSSLGPQMRIDRRAMTLWGSHLDAGTNS